MKDIWTIVDMIIKEEKLRTKSKSLDVDSLYAISKQIPFFACPNVFYNSDNSLVISKYFYCKEFGIPPHEGTYQEQPNRWIEHAFLIGNIMNKQESVAYAKANTKG